MEVNMSKSITELVQDLQKENDSLKRLSKLANQYTKMEFGYSVKELHEIIRKCAFLEQKFKSYDETYLSE